MRVAESPSIASRIEQAFQSASTDTGISFDYLVKTAQRESSFNPTAKARTSSATGLFQFIESTWLETMKEAGPKHGLDKYANAIERTSRGYRVSDPNMRREILDLRKDPEISSLMAGALTQKNADHLRSKIGRDPTDGELYMAHFLGATGASRLIDAAASNADMRADALFSAQARANKPIFYHRNGAPRSMAEVYEVIVSKHDAVTMIASVNPLKEEGITKVAALPNAKPDVPSQPTNLLALAEEAQRLTPQQRLDQSPLFPAPEPVTATVTAPPPTPPAPATQTATAESEMSLDQATERVLSAFRATETADPFKALFRNDTGAQNAVVSARFASAFSAVEQTPYSGLSGASSRVVAQQMARVEAPGPLDLTRFLRYDEEKAKRELLPPA
ncbi:transglycosylase-like protein with SLT domain [Roseibium hamelinense]|uniref:Transglycosylase-like protein with SLT domain n=1 Tax=Roseibium hamelinense TaxID=150831 RepID=A0A562TA92_9HYPH|nr:transglycosylase SLT domain-containing protein [Roseibium hamelinense]MTI42231.1 lytic transglycosylase domain-containing protein [Roseibium hamelinense]TWI90552.1 transglycosylase-like protein with SLT domain [Roseibium hamelinense]